MKQIDPERLAARLRAWLDHGGALEAILEIGAEFNMLADQAMRMAAAGQHDEEARRLARDLRAALEPILSASPWLADVLVLLNHRAPEEAKMTAAERLLDLIAPGKPKAEAIAALLEALVIAHEGTSTRQQLPALRRGLASDNFKTWLRNRLAAQQAAAQRDQEPTTHRKVFDEELGGSFRKAAGRWRQLPGEAAGSATPTDLALASAVIRAPRERELARHLSGGATLEEAAAAMKITEGTVRVLLGRLHRRAE